MTLDVVKIESWPSKPPDMDVTEVRRSLDFTLFRTAESHVYRFKDAPIIYKSGGSFQVYSMMELAGNCTVTPRGRALSLYHDRGAND